MSFRFETITFFSVNRKQKWKSWYIWDPLFPTIKFTIEICSKPPSNISLNKKDGRRGMINSLMHKSIIKMILATPEDKFYLMKGNTSILSKQFHKYLNIFLRYNNLALYLLDTASMSKYIFLILWYLNQIF